MAYRQNILFVRLYRDTGTYFSLQKKNDTDIFRVDFLLSNLIRYQ